jgi:3-hydroxyacyl-CoA dehydrogenase
MQINSVAVVGAGTMGASIAVALVSNGYSVLLKETNQELMRVGLENIEKLHRKQIEKGASPDDIEQQRKRIAATTDYSTFADVDLVIEAVPEKIEIKKVIFEELDEYCNVNAILATNTSSLPITQIAAFTRRPDKVVGLHFFNPAHLMKLVEVIPGLDTSAETVETALQFGQSLGKLAVRVEECPSFLVNRLLGRYMNEALFCLEEGATIEEIDKAASDFAFPIGPLAQRDMNGADIGLAVATFNYQEYGERFKPPAILKKMVDATLLGRKSGAGFYLYDKKTQKRLEPNPKVAELLGKTKKSSDFTVARLFLPMK